MKLGIGTYAYMWSIGFEGARAASPMTAMGLLKQARALGVRVVQYGPNLALDGLPPAELTDLLATSREWGIEIEVGTRGLEPAHLLRQLELAEHCGSVLLRTVPEAGGHVCRGADLAALLREAEPRFRQAGVRLAIENSLVPAAELSAVLGEVGSDYVGITLDTVNSLAIPEGTEEVARSLARWTHCLHVKDFAVSGVAHDGVPRGRPAGGKGAVKRSVASEVARRGGRACERDPRTLAAPAIHAARDHRARKAMGRREHSLSEDINQGVIMPKTVAVIGAGGKMGARAAEKIGFGDAFRVLLCESNRERAQAIEDKGLKVIPTDEAMAEADFVVMAVPDDG